MILSNLSNRQVYTPLSNTCTLKWFKAVLNIPDYRRFHARQYNMNGTPPFLGGQLPDTCTLQDGQFDVFFLTWTSVILNKLIFS